MVWCAAVGCSNYKKKNRDLTFLNFPRDKEIADEVIYLCEKHFEDDCFDKSVDLRNSLHTSEWFIYYI